MKQGTMNILFFILKTKLLKNGEAPILMRITIDGHYEEARIQRSVLPKQWDSAKGCSKGKDRSAKELNAYIAELSALALQKHKELMLELALITPKLLLKRVFGKETEMRTLLGTINEEIEKMKLGIQKEIAIWKQRLCPVATKQWWPKCMAYNQKNGKCTGIIRCENNPYKEDCGEK